MTSCGQILWIGKIWLQQNLSTFLALIGFVLLWARCTARSGEVISTRLMVDLPGPSGPLTRSQNFTPILTTGKKFRTYPPRQTHLTCSNRGRLKSERQKLKLNLLANRAIFRETHLFQTNLPAVSDLPRKTNQALSKENATGFLLIPWESTPVKLAFVMTISVTCMPRAKILPQSLIISNSGLRTV